MEPALPFEGIQNKCKGKEDGIIPEFVLKTTLIKTVGISLWNPVKPATKAPEK